MTKRFWILTMLSAGSLSLQVVCLVFPALAVQSAEAAGITVTTFDGEFNSDGDCSLREAITAANTDSAVDTCSTGNFSDTNTPPAPCAPVDRMLDRWHRCPIVLKAYWGYRA